MIAGMRKTVNPYHTRYWKAWWRERKISGGEKESERG